MREAQARLVLPAELIDLDFPAADAAWNGLGQAGDGTVYCAAGTHGLDCGVRLFVLPQGASSAEPVADLDAALPKPQKQAIPHGKVHVDLLPIGDALLGATHIGYYARPPGAQASGAAGDYEPYPGGWFFSIRQRHVTALAQAPHGEGIISMAVDPQRGVAFALSWPRGLLLELDLDSSTVRNHGPALGAGEAGSQQDGTWVRICRGLGIDPRNGAVFFSDGGGQILRYANGAIETVASLPQPETWLKVAWHPFERVFYGVMWSAGALFRFDPASLACEPIGVVRLPEAPAEVVTSLAFVLDASADKIHVLAVGPGLLRGRQVQLPGTSVYLTHDLQTGRNDVHGALRSVDGRWITRAESLLISGQHAVSVCWAEVPIGDRSPRARQVRKHRRRSPQYRFGGYVEEVVLMRFPRG